MYTLLFPFFFLFSDDAEDARLATLRWLIKIHGETEYASTEEQAGGTILVSNLVASLFPRDPIDPPDPTGGIPSIGPNVGSGDIWTVRVKPGSSGNPNDKTNTNWLGQYRLEDGPWIDVPQFSPARNPIYHIFGANQRSTAAQNTPRLIEAGDRITVESGDYPRNWLSHTFKNTDDITLLIGDIDDRPIFLRSFPFATNDTFYHEYSGGNELRNFIIEVDGRAGVKTPGSNSGLTGPDLFHFNCDLIGGWNAESDAGYKSGKWGFHGYDTGEAIRKPYGNYGFIWWGGSVSGIFKEHGFYTHNIKGGHLWDSVNFKWCGRTAIQVVNRLSEGAFGYGDVVIRNCKIEDVCLEPQGGGSAITVKGNLDGDVIIKNNVVKLGGNPNLHPSVQGNITGSIVIEWGKNVTDSANNAGVNNTVLVGNTFEVGKFFGGVDDARRTNVVIQASRRLQIKTTTIKQYPGASKTALDIWEKSVGRYDTDAGDWGTGKPIPNSIYLDDDNVIVGECRWGSTTYPTYQLMLNDIKDDVRVVIF